MTTIAFDGVTMAADGRSTYGDCITDENYVKIKSINGKLFGFDGEVGFMKKVEHEISINLSVDDREVDKEFMYEYILYDAGYLLSYRNDRKYPTVVYPPFAIGTGGLAAIAVMRAGLNAEEAVKVAITMDVYSGGKITVLTLGD